MIPVPAALAFGRNRGGSEAFRQSFRQVRLNPAAGGPDLTEEQQEAHDKMLGLLAQSLDEQGVLIKGSDAPSNVIVVVLAGAAGTGKTTLMRTLMASLRKRGVATYLMAPTGKAASRLKQVTGEETRTIHGSFFKGANTVGVCPKCGESSDNLGILTAAAVRKGLSTLRCEHCGGTFRVPDDIVGIEKKLKFNQGDQMPEVAVAIVDESSMISKKLYREMMDRVPTQWRILFVGDKEQLQPVVMGPEPKGWGVNFDKPDVTLNKVLRQAAGNPIIQLATIIRLGENGTSYWAYDPDKVTADARLRTFRVGAWEPAVQDYVKHRLARTAEGTWDTAKQDVVMLTFINSTRRMLNKMIREQLILPKSGLSIAQTAWNAGMSFTAGDRLLITFNNHALGLMNGEVYSVVAADYIDGEARKWGLLRLTIRLYNGTTRAIYTRDQAVGLSPQLYELGLEENRNRYNDVTYALASMLPKDVKPQSIMASVSPEALWAAARCVTPWSFVQCDYGDCISIVKSQGSQWKNVIIVWDESTQKIMEKKDSEGDEFGRRLAYTALTRASDTVHVYMVALRAPFDKMKEFELKLDANKAVLPAWMDLKPYKTGPDGEAIGEDDSIRAARRVLAAYKGG